MDATALLKEDHDAVRKLFKEYEKQGDRALKGKQRIFDEVKQELEIHTAIEEEIFYPAVKNVKSKEAEDIVLEAVEEHRVVKTLLREISALSADDDRFDAKFKVLQENVEHHAEEEESEMFPEAKKKLSKEELQELGGRMEARKEALKANSKR